MGPDYLVEYEKFQVEFKKTETSPDQVGEMIMRMAGYYARYNLRYADTLHAFSRVMEGLINSPDTQTAKAMTASKAEMLGNATPECAAFQLARIHVANIQEYINSLKSLQKSLMVEYGHVQ